MVSALRADDWKELLGSWAEFWDMHALFETSSPPFGYMSAFLLKFYIELRTLAKKEKGPLVTMDAGPTFIFCIVKTNRNWQEINAEFSSALKFLRVQRYE